MCKKRWDEIKAEERKRKPADAAGSARYRAARLPALVEAQQITSRAAGVGFDWENADRCSKSWTKNWPSSTAARERGSQDEIEDELGDLLFVLVNLARFVKVDPEQALRRTNAKFRAALRAYRAASGRAGQAGVAGTPIEELEALWQEAKKSVRHRAAHDRAAVPRSGGTAEDDLGLRRDRTAAGAVVRGGDQGRRPGVRRVRRRPHGRFLPRDSRAEAGRASLICTATCWACCRNIGTAGSAAG